MHLVHIKHGLDKSKIGFTSDSVTVIAVLIEVSSEIVVHACRREITRYLDQFMLHNSCCLVS